MTSIQIFLSPLKMQSPPGCKEKRFLATLEDKKNYVIHCRNLKQCISQGLVVTKIHKILKFHQECWLKSYIDLNTKCRSEAKSNFEKNFYKLMNNAIFGKTMEQIRKRVDNKLCSNSKKIEKLVSKPDFKDRTIFSENLVAIHMNKTSILFNKPVTIGMSILDISKTLMYEFHYTFMKKSYGENLHLLYTDTDSFIYNIQTADFYQDVKKNIDMFDTSDYPEDNQFSIPLVNKKVFYRKV